MKAVLISIQPKWCELIALGKKTVEIRKTKPKLDPPFKVYIYCTIGDGAKGDILPQSRVTCGKVIGEFVCDRIHTIEDITKETIMNPEFQLILFQTWLSLYDLLCYLDRDAGNQKGYGWHISDLVIYEKPRPLSDFYKCGAESMDELSDREELCQYCSDTGYGEYATYSTPNGPVMCEGQFCDKAYQEYLDENFALTRPPQSWCYVEGGE